MASLSEAKSLGGIGSILAFIPGVSIVGWILILFAIRETSEVLQDRTVFDDAIIAALASIVGSVAFLAILFGGLFRILFFVAGGAFLLALTLLLIGWISWIVSAAFLKRSYDKIGHRLGVAEFGTAGILLLVGALLTVVLIGFLIALIALIFQTVAYFSIHDQPYPPPYMGMPQQPPPPMSSPPILPLSQPAAQSGPPQQSQSATPVEAVQQSQPEFKYCFRCGARLSSSAAFCSSCGTKQP